MLWMAEGFEEEREEEREEGLGSARETPADPGAKIGSNRGEG